MTLTLITPPTTEPISLEEARLQCRITAGDTTEDALLNLYIQAAREAAEHELGRALLEQAWELTLDAFPAGEISLGRGKALAITSVKYLDVAGALQTLDPGAYTLDAATLPGWLLPAADTSWPATASVVNAVRIRFTAGYGATAASVPAAVRQWLLVTLAALYSQREALDASGRVAVLPGRFVDRLLDAEKVWA
ncbi:head-tail connector protein [Pseudaquabacterium pictum]|uniref:PhiE125 gp8 family phage protein n=1 Tax=Pseudaquabacterium pictum TaxID=2315236 RepID=A0A480APA9_9BURK|nr:phage head-tail connector protein [Rubrivivax pictus]GCL61495.1 hypothetical protein AQPW35_05760 [Rubrivivax pictus]